MNHSRIHSPFNRWLSAFLLFCLSVFAAGNVYADCTVYNATSSGDPAIITDCRMFSTTNHPVMEHIGVATIQAGFANAGLIPPPANGRYFGTITDPVNLLNVGVNTGTICPNVGGYAGNVAPLPAVDDNVYCAEYEGVEGTVYIRGKWDVGLNQFTNIAIWPSQPEQIPTLPLWGLIILTGLIGMFGAFSQKRRRQ